MIENAATLGPYFVEQLARIESPYVKEVRGKGLMIVVELVEDAGGARGFCDRLKEKGLLCKETHENVIRFAPPLIIRKEEIDWSLERIKEVLTVR
jgi:ornithine--oxo-acid transaminase